MSVILDASVFGPIVIPDESDNLLPGLAELINSGEAIVPAHWYLEVTNLLIIALRKGRLDEDDRRIALDTLDAAAVSVEPLDRTALTGATFELAERHRLTSYDAVYLAMARDRGASLATADRALVRAAEAEGVALFGR